MGWRGAVLIYAAVQVVLVLPLHHGVRAGLAGRAPPQGGGAGDAGGGAVARPVRIRADGGVLHQPGGDSGRWCRCMRWSC
jgi:hypothetical protein